jgi:hypothetical protein
MAGWEVVNATCHRLEVPGGWLYKTWDESIASDYYGLKFVVPGTVNVTFVPRESRDDKGAEPE